MMAAYQACVSSRVPSPAQRWNDTDQDVRPLDPELTHLDVFATLCETSVMIPVEGFQRQFRAPAGPGGSGDRPCAVWVSASRRLASFLSDSQCHVDAMWSRELIASSMGRDTLPRCARPARRQRRSAVRLGRSQSDRPWPVPQVTLHIRFRQFSSSPVDSRPLAAQLGRGGLCHPAPELLGSLSVPPRSSRRRFDLGDTHRFPGVQVDDGPIPQWLP